MMDADNHSPEQRESVLLGILRAGQVAPAAIGADAAVAQLRHLYRNLTEGGVRDTAQAKRIAEGLLAPAIAALERAALASAAPAPIGADAMLREALWTCVEHNALHFGESHNTVVQGRAALASAAQPAAPANVAAWMTPEGDRVVTEKTMAGARKDGGAILSSLRPYSVPLVHASAAQPEREPHPPHRDCGCVGCAPSFEADEPTLTVTMRYDLSPAAIEGAIRDKLIEMGWTPPDAAAPKAAPAEQPGAAYAALPVDELRTNYLRTCYRKSLTRRM